MDPHRLAEERSLAYHRAIAERMPSDPSILLRARARVAEWRAPGGDEPFYVRRWREILERDPESIAAFLLERSELATELRQSSPFAGVLDPRERWRIWRETRESLEGRP